MKFGIFIGRFEVKSCSARQDVIGMRTFRKNDIARTHITVRSIKLEREYIRESIPNFYGTSLTRWRSSLHVFKACSNDYGTVENTEIGSTNP